MTELPFTQPAKKPLIPLQPGQNYRFHFDATKCIGCKCCEVACHEQNNNPPAVKWRQVGEIEGGVFPETRRLHISMACNHCLEPSCLIGCPVDAYDKDEKTGVVHMKDDACIGCQYCTWNCPYGAPQFNAERGMVTKCDLCHNRIAEGRNPACVEACPSGALEIERFNVEEWKKNLSAANAPGVPDAAITCSTTRFTLPKNLDVGLDRTDEYRLHPEKPHYSLVFMSVMTQLSVGGFLALFLAELLSDPTYLSPLVGKFLQTGPLAMLITAALALGTSVFHLGRPIFAWRALKMWKRSWLSREVLCFTLFAITAAAYSIIRWLNLPVSSGLLTPLGIIVALLGIAGIYSTSRIYMVPARPSWNSSRTPIAFFSTAFILGPLATLCLFSWLSKQTAIPLLANGGGTISKTLVTLVIVGGFLQLGAILMKLVYFVSRAQHELRGTAKLLTQWFRYRFITRLGTLLLTVLCIPMALVGLLESKTGGGTTVFWIAGLMIMALGSELLGRYLFFVTVVPKNRPEGFF